MKPTRKVSVGAVAGALAGMLTWFFDWKYQVRLPPGAEVLSATVFTFIVQWIVPDNLEADNEDPAIPSQG